MEKKFSSLMTASNVKVGGVDFVADVMNNLDRSSEKTSLTAWPSTTSLWRMRSASACLCLRTSLPWMTVRCSGLSGTAIPEIWCWRSRAQTAMWPTKFSPICRPAWRRASGGSGDHQQCPHPGRGGGPAAHCWDHPGLGGTQRADHPSRAERTISLPNILRAS